MKWENFGPKRIGFEKSKCLEDDKPMCKHGHLSGKLTLNGLNHTHA